MRQIVIVAMVLGGVSCRRDAPIGTRPCGMSLAHSWAGQGAHGYGTADSARALDELGEDGMRAVSLSPFAFMDHLDDATLTWSAGTPGTETFASIRTMIAQAHSKHLEVMLKPQIYLRDGQWCGDIAPAKGWSTWFASYRDYVTAIARIAEDTRVAYLIVGVEMSSSSSSQETEWRRTIAAVRDIYHGKILYSANWDEADHVAFWDAVDIMGVQMYAPLRHEGQSMTAKTIERGAARWLRKYEGIAKRYDKQIIVTETGFVNRVGVTMLPYVWPEWLVDELESLDGDAEQAAGYEALIATFGRSPHVLRIFWWKWFTDVDGFSDDGPLGFAVRGRFAEHVLRRACAR